MLTIQKNLTSLTLDFAFITEFEEEGILCQNLSPLSANLHTLNLQGVLMRDLGPGKYAPVYLDPAINFPVLRSLTLKELYYTSAVKAMDFWERHPTLEY